MSNAAGNTVRLSVLETAPVWRDGSPAESIRQAVELARSVDELGYTRFWVAEHHNAPFIASCAPPVLAGQVLAATRYLRVGSGGVMLPNHPPLVVAEQFGTLEVLHPGRVDLGLGRSPGTDPETARALRRISAPPGSSTFAEQLIEIIDYFRPGQKAIEAVPARDDAPDIWLLGGSPESGTLAGRLGLPLAYAYHVNPTGAAAAVEAYRLAFTPTGGIERPYVMVSASVIAAETDRRAEWLAGPTGLVILQALNGNRNQANPTPEDVAGYGFTAEERALIGKHLRYHLIGSERTIADRVAELVAETGADEIMALSLIRDLEDRLTSYRVLAAAVRAGDYVAR